MKIVVNLSSFVNLSILIELKKKKPKQQQKNLKPTKTSNYP